jgi:hypothetical protein
MRTAEVARNESAKSKSRTAAASFNRFLPPWLTYAHHAAGHRTQLASRSATVTSPRRKESSSLVVNLSEIQPTESTDSKPRRTFECLMHST